MQDSRWSPTSAEEGATITPLYFLVVLLLTETNPLLVFFASVAHCYVRSGLPLTPRSFSAELLPCQAGPNFYHYFRDAAGL